MDKKTVDQCIFHLICPTPSFRGRLELYHIQIKTVGLSFEHMGKTQQDCPVHNDECGNMVWLSAVLTSAELEPDPIAEYAACLPNCRICLESCPVEALDGVSMGQKACWGYAFGTHNGGEWRIKCFTCREICPNRFGIRKEVLPPPSS